MKIVFMGTPDFAVESLKKLNNTHHEILAVVTQPDKLGNHNQVTMSAVKKYALDLGLKVLQYNKVSVEGIDEIIALQPDIIVTVAFGQILSRKFLTVASKGVINVHASLLPKYRGASPIQSAILNCEKETGVTIMKTAYEVDSGDIILQEKTNIGFNETAGELFDRLSIMGADLLIKSLELIENGQESYIKQNLQDATFCKMLDKTSGIIDFSKSFNELNYFINAMNPWPSAFTYYNNKLFKIWKIEKFESQIIENVPNGYILYADKPNGIVVKNGDGAIRLIEVQFADGKRMNSYDFVNGRKIEQGSIFKSEQ
jgi:methionyl-tRNA formyltransferase